MNVLRDFAASRSQPSPLAVIQMKPFSHDKATGSFSLYFIEYFIAVDRAESTCEETKLFCFNNFD